MLYGLLSILFSLSCIFLILLILIQKTKSSLGLGSMGGGSQMLFGGSGGQDIFQKLTWGFGALLIIGSLGLAILRSTTYEGPRAQHRPAQQTQMPISFD